jgi:hypothetical protein
MNSIVSDGQSLLDVCIQELGDVATAFDLADANGLAITDQLQAGQQLVVPASVLSRPEVARYFAGRQQRINTTNLTSNPAPLQEGLVDHNDNDHDAEDFF